MTTSGPAAKWRLRQTETGLQLGQLRAFGTETFTWSDLLRGPLGTVQVYALYFPSRFDLPVDAEATQSLRIFGDATSGLTSVNFWTHGTSISVPHSSCSGVRGGHVRGRLPRACGEGAGCSRRRRPKRGSWWPRRAGG